MGFPGMRYVDVLEVQCLRGPLSDTNEVINNERVNGCFPLLIVKKVRECCLTSRLLERGRGGSNLLW
ncbi:hypothetical protein GLOTRDRAFT_109184 [Gloeophyllum trabeum ATCC 11539]|uniref:Uncharacterized protein n=1 Tax=Gloeophyllum trabeum (strain ATCC 11539 / FP-39264 / Madison 617) TaxID=670483 RepID=S7QN08_GLOTA|nr:uncharacterized protein GLOTRDRAFT_109184 [Gloeophyllum trabeum ATCC 11539]EPQ60878.1 hypothetical protein GLOTRDRAFT_109184 [Gloeophyllum trabeum ATCC 11539]